MHSPTPVTGAWRPGRPGRPAAVPPPSPPTGRSPSTAAAACATSPSPTRRGAQLDATALQRRARVPRLDRRQPRRRPDRPRPPDAGLVGGRRRTRPGRSTPTATSSCAPTCSAAARARPGRRRSTRRRPRRTAPASRSSRSATWCGSRRALADHLGIDAWLTRDRRLDGRDAGRSSGRITYPRPGALDHPDRHVRAGHRAADRVGRHRPAGHPPRPGLARRRLLRRRRRATGPHEGLAVARMVAQITFRVRRRVHRPLRPRAGRPPTASGFDLWQRFEVERYLDHHGDKLVRRFDANSYLVLSARRWTSTTWAGAGAASSAAMARITVPMLAVGIWSDMLYPSTSSARSGELLVAGRRARPSTWRSTRPTATTPSSSTSTRWATPSPGLPRRGGEAMMSETDATSQPGDRRHPGGPRRQRHGAGAGRCGRRRRSSRRALADGPAHVDGAARRAVLQPLLQPVGEGVRGRRRRARRGRGGAGLRVGHGRDGHASCSPCARPATTSSPSATSTRARSCSCRARAPASASTSPSSTRTEPGAFAAAVRAGPHDAGRRRDAGQPAARAHRPGRAGRHRRARSRWSTPPSPRRSSSSRCRSASTSCCTRPRRASPATTTPRSAWWRASAT